MRRMHARKEPVMTAAAQPITIGQLARLYQARNEANKRMSQALRAKSGVAEAKSEAGRLNRAYVDALKTYKRQQKSNRETANDRRQPEQLSMASRQR